LRGERVMEAVDVILVQPFQRLVAEGRRQIVEALDLEQRQKPFVQNQFTDKWDLRPIVGAAPPGSRRVAGGDLLAAPGHQRPSPGLPIIRCH